MTVAGLYGHDNGRIAGRVIGNKNIGTWSEATGYSPPGNAGDCELVMPDDCRSFDGGWKIWKQAGSLER